MSRLAGRPRCPGVRVPRPTMHETVPPSTCATAAHAQSAQTTQPSTAGAGAGTAGAPGAPRASLGAGSSRSSPAPRSVRLAPVNQLAWSWLRLDYSTCAQRQVRRAQSRTSTRGERGTENGRTGLPARARPAARALPRRGSTQLGAAQLPPIIHAPGASGEQRWRDQRERVRARRARVRRGARARRGGAPPAPRTAQPTAAASLLRQPAALPPARPSPAANRGIIVQLRRQMVPQVLPLCVLLAEKSRSGHMHRQASRVRSTELARCIRSAASELPRCIRVMAAREP